MATDCGNESGALCRHHLEMAGDVRETKTRLRTAEDNLEDLRNKIDKAIEKSAHADGFVCSTIPDIQQRLEKAFNLVGELEETANVYFGQIRDMAKDLENLTTQILLKANKTEVDNKADAGETKEGIKNCFTWVRAGFVGVAITLLLWVLVVLAEKYGLPKP
jgi:chromosome segregation ATPase